MKISKQLLILILLIFFPSICFSATLGTVKDSNNGNKGDILINSGKLVGKKNDIGEWVNIKNYPELKGKQGNQGISGKNGIDGYTPIKGIDYFDGKDIDSKLVEILNNNICLLNTKTNNLNNRLNKLEKTQYKIQTNFRIIDTKRISIAPYISHNFTRQKIDEVGIKITVKLCKSYEEKEIEKLQKELKKKENETLTNKVKLIEMEARLNYLMKYN